MSQIARDATGGQADLPALPQATLFKSVADGIGAWRRRRAAVRALHEFDDRMLQDIGLIRSDIDWAVERAARGE